MNRKNLTESSKMSDSIEKSAASVDQQPVNANSTNDTLIRLAIDLGPLFTFFGLYFLVSKENAEAIIHADNVSRLILATIGYMIVTAIVLTFAYIKQGRLAPMPLITGAIVVFFGGLTVILKDDTFIKMKPTIINTLFATVLISGLLTGRPFMKYLFQEVFQLSHQGWRTLTIRWTGFFILLAVLNEIVWRNFPEEFWVSFKIFGVLPLTMIFGAFQLPLLTKYAPHEDDQLQ